MTKFKADFIKRWFITYFIVISYVYLGGYAYWYKADSYFWACRAIDGNRYSGGCNEPTGPLWALLVIVIPFVVTLLFLITAILVYRHQKSRQK